MGGSKIDKDRGGRNISSSGTSGHSSNQPEKKEVLEKDFPSKKDQNTQDTPGRKR